MTVEQTTLEGFPCTLVNGKPLTGRQEFVWHLVRTSHGISAEETGAWLHFMRGKHGEDQRCQWDVQEGNGVLRSKALATLVTRRRTGLWHPRNPNDSLVEAAAAPTAQGDGAASTGEYDPRTSEIPW